MRKNSYLTKDGSIRYQSIKKLLTTTNELWIAINKIAQECGVPSGDFMGNPEQIGKKTVKTVFTPSDIIYKINKKFGVNIKAKSRTDNVVMARFAACHLLANNTLLSLNEIAKEIGYTHHTTVMHGKKQAMELMVKNDNFRSMVELLDAELKKEIPLSN